MLQIIPLKISKIVFSIFCNLVLRNYFFFTLSMLIATVRLHAFRECALFITASPRYLLCYYIQSRLSDEYLVVMLFLHLYTVGPILISLFSSPYYICTPIPHNFNYWWVGLVLLICSSVFFPKKIFHRLVCFLSSNGYRITFLRSKTKTQILYLLELYKNALL